MKKKLMMIVGICALTVVLVGCEKSKSSSFKCTNDNGVYKEEIVVYYDGDNVNKIVTNMIYVSASNAKSMYAMYQAFSDSAGDENGKFTSISLSEKTITVVLSGDELKYSYDAAKGFDTRTSLNKKDIKSGYETAGYTCSEN